ncbi:LacI family transcriptional regulator [Atopobacter sp. AH10]|uniref:LacI family DNA-binding transcriptional regulator n=1 Tax=Atopobacter sp. AH10 TaxID=2315861 RepID=UPI000EF28598|nr:LacI family DNA-binding transcriptional regulator [Atopobacter sp. AH10]RLK64213.1 LacI family transcriptional regulator [Atopobacter sp. AH10]
MAVTIKDVARLANVSPSTVSRVIADNPSISTATKRRVRRIMDELNYYPNLSARSLASKKSQTIGLVLPQASDAFYQNPFFPTVMRGINEASSSKGYGLLISTGQNEEDRLSHIQRMVYGKQVEGLIFLYAMVNDPILEFVSSINFPVVVIGSPDNSQVNLVDNDNELIGKQATKALIEKGCRKPVYIGGDEKQPFIHNRELGFKAALKEAHLPSDHQNSFHPKSFMPDEGYALAKQILAKGEADGFVVADQLVARGVRHAIAQSQQADIPLITFKPYAPSLYTGHATEACMNLHGQTLGEQAVYILFDVLRDEENKGQRYIHEIVKSELIPGLNQQ